MSLLTRLGLRKKQKKEPLRRAIENYRKKGFPPIRYEEEELARKAIDVVVDHSMATYPRMVMLWEQVRYLDRAGIEGSFVECGTWRGGSCGMMALAHMRQGKPSRQIHLFDSFEGLPEPDAAHDGADSVSYSGGKAAGELQAIGQCVGTLEDNSALMNKTIGYPEELTVYHVGWFQDTVPADAPKLGQIALLRLDGDWYESTKICLEHLYHKVAPGGMVIIDDYGRWSGCKKAVDEFMATLPVPKYLNRIDNHARYIIV